MNVYIKNHTYWFELENVTRLFLPNEKISVFREFGQLEKPYVYTELSERITVSLCAGDFCEELTAPKNPDGDNELIFAQLLYKLFVRFSGMNQPWGLLTGVRPLKLLRRLIASEGREGAERRFLDDFYVSEEKLSLALETERNEKRIIDMSGENSFSLYVGIPFCPSRCSYCSFVMASVERAKKLIEPFTELLCEEIRRTGEIASRLGLRLETVYFGGGTPTTLDPDQLSRVLGAVNSSFDMSRCREFTVEAGRPDTIDSERLNALKENKVDRISINPQTLNPAALKAIGRKHSVEDFYRAFELARKNGFNNINPDLIAGLPEDDPESFYRSLDGILELGAESVTVHTLCRKRAATLTTQGVTLDVEDAEAARKMLAYARKRLSESGFIPYYLYRQTRMAGNLENVGWSKPGYESLYNVYVMDETHTILACGAGGVTKLKEYGGDYLKRVFNFKYPYEYIDRFEELLDRKREISEFYFDYNS
jgi:oxygen-independent coproporphyrinogen-3 oxidase